MRLVAFESCGPRCGVALADESGLLGDWTGELGNAVAGPVLEALAQLTHKSGWTLDDVDLFAACTGPGSFTGVKIAVTLAKTLAYAHSKKVIGVTSLDAIALSLCAPGAAAPDEARVAAFMPAKKAWVYMALYEGCRCAREGTALPLADVPDALAAWTSRPAVAVGPVELPPLAGNFHARPDVYPGAALVARLALARASAGELLDPAALMPTYISPPSISRPKRPLRPQ
jgi:tRNA threonylcarbamoyl adenosine modification protein YeaZ